jgi:hypothetical protein
MIFFVIVSLFDELLKLLQPFIKLNKRNKMYRIRKTEI